MTEAGRDAAWRSYEWGGLADRTTHASKERKIAWKGETLVVAVPERGADHATVIERLPGGWPKKRANASEAMGCKEALGLWWHDKNGTGGKKGREERS